jgi:hypothetical protein
MGQKKKIFPFERIQTVTTYRRCSASAVRVWYNFSDNSRRRQEAEFVMAALPPKRPGSAKHLLQDENRW